MKFNKDEVYCFAVKSVEEIEAVQDILNSLGIMAALNRDLIKRCLQDNLALVLDREWSDKLMINPDNEDKEKAIWIDVDKLIEYHSVKRETVTIESSTFYKDDFEEATKDLKTI